MDSITEKVCTRCGQLKPIESFYLKSRYDKLGKRRSECSSCNTLNQKGYLDRNPQQRRRAAAYNQQRNRELRIQALRVYGGKCVCCGECAFEFLCFDHVNGGGSQMRKEGYRHRGPVFYLRLIRDKPEGYRVLCNNCNQSYGIHGYCPHQRAKNKDA